MKLSPNELATDEQKDARDAESKASTLERRADYYQIARAGIQVRGITCSHKLFENVNSARQGSTETDYFCWYCYHLWKLLSSSAGEWHRP